MQGDSDVRMMAQTMIGKQMKVVDFIVRKLLTCGGNDGGITFSDDMKTCADERNQDFNTCVPENGMMAPLKVEEASVVQPVEKEKEASPTEAAEEGKATAALVVSPQCIKVTDPLDTKRTYRGTPVITGLSSIDYLAGVESLHSLLGFVGGEMEKKCIDIAVRAASSWLAPSCSKDCEPRKPCVSWCKRVAKQCFPAHVLGMFGQVELGGTLRSDLESQVTSKTSLLIIDRVLGWISNDCDNSNDFSKKEETCQKEMDTTTCRVPVPVPATERMTATETSNATTTTTSGVGGSTSAGGTQHMMATIVEGAVDSAKGEIGSMIPKIENELIKQEDSLAGKLSKAEMSLVGASDENKLTTSAASTGEGELTGTQRMMSTVVEGAVDKAKGQIGSLVPNIEREILKQESELETKLGRAEASLTGEKDQTLSNMTVAEEEEEEEEEAAAAAAASTSNVSASTLSPPLAFSTDADADAATVHNDDDKQDAQVKHHQSLDAASKVNMTTSSSTEQQVEPQPSRRPSKMKYEDVRKYVPPSWQKDVVVDMEAGVAMRMLDDNAVKPL